MTWQPIETAPKDRAILVSWPNDGSEEWKGDPRVRVAYWDEDAPMHLGYGDTGWTDVTTGEGCYCHYGAVPTHWLPLPDPPAD